MLTIVDEASPAQRHLDACFVVPADIGIEFSDKLFLGGSSPLACVEELDLQPAEERLASRVIGRAALAGHRSCQISRLEAV